uniref:Uncharacterized protein n=1 Tax=Myoviridae sp. ctXXl13 TaxID=2827691 RepID=A0A8S5TKF0_9CAUD|nr:MAG TPA: hypothetical protein [Myoviridae sp. ctXXl13]
MEKLGDGKRKTGERGKKEKEIEKGKKRRKSVIKKK